MEKKFTRPPPPPPAGVFIQGSLEPLELPQKPGGREERREGGREKGKDLRKKKRERGRRYREEEKNPPLSRVPTAMCPGKASRSSVLVLMSCTWPRVLSTHF